MKKALFIHIIWLIVLAVLISAGIKFYSIKKKQIDDLNFALEKSEREKEGVKSEFSGKGIQHNKLLKENKNLMEELRMLKDDNKKLGKYKDVIEEKNKTIIEKNEELHNKLDEMSFSYEKQIQKRKSIIKEKLEITKKKYIKKEGDFLQRIETLKNKIVTLDKKGENIDKVITQAMADVGREKFKFHYYNQGLSFEYYNRYQEAVKQYKKALQVDPDAAEVYLQLSSIYTYDIINFEKAEFYAKKYAKLKYIESLMPEDIEDIQKSAEELPLPFLKEKLAEISFAKVSLEGKVSSMKESFKEKQEQINRLKKIAQKKEVIELQLQETEKTFKEETLKFHYNMALTYDRSKFYKNAAKEYLEALEIFPDDPDSHYNLALVYDDHLKDKSKAIRHYKRYLELRPGGSDATKVEYWIVRAEKEMESEGQVFWPKKKDY